MATATAAADSRAHVVAGSTTPGGPSDSALSAAAEKTAGCSPLKEETPTEEVRSLAGRVRDTLSDPAARSGAIQALCDCLLRHHKRWEDSAKANLERTARMNAVRERFTRQLPQYHSEAPDYTTNYLSLVEDFTSENVENIRVLAAAALALSENVPACQDVVRRLEQMGLMMAHKLEVEANLGRVVEVKLELDAMILDNRGSMTSMLPLLVDMLRLNLFFLRERSVSIQHQQIIEDWPFLFVLSHLFIHRTDAQALTKTFEGLPRPYALESLQSMQRQLNTLKAACEAIDLDVKARISSYSPLLVARDGRERNPTESQYFNYQRKAYVLYHELNGLLNRLRVINLALLKPDLATLHDKIQKKPLDATQHTAFMEELAGLLPLVREGTKIRKPVDMKEDPETAQSQKEVLELFRAIAMLLDNEKNRINGITGFSRLRNGCTTCTDWVKNLHSAPTGAAVAAAAAAAAAASPTPGEAVHSS